MSVIIKHRFILTWNAEDLSAAEHRQAPHIFEISASYLRADSRFLTLRAFLYLGFEMKYFAIDEYAYVIQVMPSA
ncbi:hypothetical protein BCU84_20110 [Shewanella sp. 10N.286.51.B7]|nr:hypothetical protein BCU84_20110 [Shewanella sp. 10N.286.51.B7]